jgi:hypothetical protein
MKKLFEKIKLALSKAFGAFLSILIKNADAAVKVVDIVKAVIENPAIDWVVALTPSEKDDELLRKAKQLTPKIMAQVAFYMGLISAIQAESDPEKAASIVFNLIADKIPNDGRGIFYRELSAEIGKALSDGEIENAEIGAIVQLVRKKILS